MPNTVYAGQKRNTPNPHGSRGGQGDQSQPGNDSDNPITISNIDLHGKTSFKGEMTTARGERLGGRTNSLILRPHASTVRGAASIFNN